MLCYVMICYDMLPYVILCYVMLYYGMVCTYVLRNSLVCYVMLCYSILCYVILCHVTLCDVMLFYFVLCQVKLRYVTLFFGMLYTYVLRRSLVCSISIQWPRFELERFLIFWYTYSLVKTNTHDTSILACSLTCMEYVSCLHLMKHQELTSLKEVRRASFNN